MNPNQHETARCQNRGNCTGPGCRVSTGKTKRKANFARPKHNQHEGTRVTANTKEKSR